MRAPLRARTSSSVSRLSSRRPSSVSRRAAASSARRATTASRRLSSSLPSPAAWPSPRNSRATVLIGIVTPGPISRSTPGTSGSRPASSPRVGVDGALLVGQGVGLGAREEVAAAVGGVGVLLDRLDDLLELGGDRVAVGRVGGVGRAAHDQLAGAVDEVGDLAQRLLRRLLPARRVLGVALLLAGGGQRLAQRHRARGVERVVGRARRSPCWRRSWTASSRAAC